MSFKEIKDKRVKKTLSLKEENKKIVDDYSEQIAKKNKQVLKEKDIKWDIEHDAYLEIFYDCLTDILANTWETIEDIYGVDTKKKESITTADIDKLTYSKDGLTLSKRLAKYFKEYSKHIPTIERMLYDLMRILNTEAMCVMNNGIRTKLKDDFTYALVEEAECCDICLDYMSEGLVLLDDFEEPPYHPNCECIAVEFTEEEAKEMDINIGE